MRFDRDDTRQTNAEEHPTKTRTRNALVRSEAWCPFHHRGRSGRRGSRTLTALRPHGLADRPGNPYPAAFRRSVDPAGVEPALPARQAGVVPLDHRPVSVRGVGVEPTLSRSQGGRITAFLPPESNGPPGNRTPISALRRRRLPVRPAAQIQRSGRGSNPVFHAYQGGVPPQHFQTFVRNPLRRLFAWATSR
jgi:hypothetical protein